MKKLILIAALLPLMAQASVRDDAQALLESAGLALSHRTATGCIVATPDPKAKTIKIGCTGPQYGEYAAIASEAFRAAGYTVEVSGLGFTVTK